MLSKKALETFVHKGFHNDSICKEDGGAEDVEFGKCEYDVTMCPSQHS